MSSFCVSHAMFIWTLPYAAQTSQYIQKINCEKCCSLRSYVPTYIKMYKSLVSVHNRGFSAIKLMVLCEYSEEYNVQIYTFYCSHCKCVHRACVRTRDSFLNTYTLYMQFYKPIGLQYIPIWIHSYIVK